MPSTLHEGLISLFRADPTLFVDLVARGFGVHLTPRPELLIDRHAELAIDARQHLHVNARSVDLVLVVEDPEDPDGGAVIAIEVQLDDDPNKRRRIAGYLGLLVDRHGLPVHIGVITLNDRVARNLASWTVGTALSIRSFVIDRHSLPPRMSVEDAQERPLAAILSGIILGFHGDLEAARLGLVTALAQPAPDRQRYAATVLAALSEERRAIFLGALTMQQQRELSELERETGTYKVGFGEGHTRGLEQGLEQGRRAVLRESILALLDARGIPVSADQVERIHAAGLSLLEHCFVAARHVDRAAELFDER